MTVKVMSEGQKKKQYDLHPDQNGDYYINGRKISLIKKSDTDIELEGFPEAESTLKLQKQKLTGEN